MFPLDFSRRTRYGVVPASGFSFSAEQIWKTIRENKDLDLPTHKVMVATVRCEDIANEKFRCLTFDEDLLALEQAAKTSTVPGFGKSISSILKKYLSEFATGTGWLLKTMILLPEREKGR